MCEDNISQSEQKALDGAENPAAVSSEQLRQLLEDEEGLAVCRLLMEVSDTGASIPDAGEELALFHRRHRHRKSLRVALVAATVVAASVVFLFLLHSRQNEVLRKEVEPLLVFKAEKQPQRYASLQIPSEKREVSPGKKDAGMPGSIFRMTSHEIVYVPSVSLSDLMRTGVIATPRMVVPYGETFRLVLSDGTEVHLNADSRLTYPERFEGGERTVYLEGEAYFKVSRDTRRPFTVMTHDMGVRVLGTEFNMRVYQGENAQVALLEGSVEVRKASSGQSIRLVPGQRVEVSDDGSMHVESVDVDQYRYWKDGYFYFDGCSLEEIMKEIGRWYNVDVEFRMRQVPQSHLHFVGDRRKTLSYTMGLLNRMEKVKVSYENGKLVVDQCK